MNEGLNLNALRVDEASVHPQDSELYGAAAQFARNERQFWERRGLPVPGAHGFKKQVAAEAKEGLRRKNSQKRP